MTSKTEELVLASINGLSAFENNKLMTLYRVMNVTQALLTFQRHPEDSGTHGPVVRKYIEELQEHLRTATNFDELASWLPPDCRVVQTRSEQAMTGENEDIYMYLELPFEDRVPGETYQGRIAIPITAKHLVLNVTPEESQDYVTLRHRDGQLTEADVKLMTRLDSLDRFSVLKLWERGYPVHAGYNHELEYMPKCHYASCEDLGLRYSVKYTTPQELRLFYKAIDNTFARNARAGRCVPDHSCCAEGMWSDDRRKAFMKLGVRQRDIEQQKDLFDRMRPQFAAQAKA